MRTRDRTEVARVASVLLAALSAAAVAGTGPARAAMVGVLEAPIGIASGISNIQGWVYTTTPGAKLVQPFDVLVDGTKVMEIPCCADRGDVQAAHPEAPLATGFSAAFNWALVAPDTVEPLAETAQGIIGPVIRVSVRVTDDHGGSLVLERDVVPVQAGFDFNRTVSWALPASPLEAPAGVPLVAECQLANTSILTPDAAEMACTGVFFEAPGGALALCTGVVFWSWDRASQSFRVTSDCLPAALP